MNCESLIRDENTGFSRFPSAKGFQSEDDFPRLVMPGLNYYASLDAYDSVWIKDSRLRVGFGAQPEWKRAYSNTHRFTVIARTYRTVRILGALAKLFLSCCYCPFFSS
jgi:hypothetical protein